MVDFCSMLVHKLQKNYILMVNKTVKRGGLTIYVMIINIKRETLNEQ